MLTTSAEKEARPDVHGRMNPMGKAEKMVEYTECVVDGKTDRLTNEMQRHNVATIRLLKALKHLAVEIFFFSLQAQHCKKRESEDQETKAKKTMKKDFEKYIYLYPC